MNVIAAVVLGGTAMSGGTGSAIGALIGSFLIMMIDNGLVIGGLGVAQQTFYERYYNYFSSCIERNWKNEEKSIRKINN